MMLLRAMLLAAALYVVRCEGEVEKLMVATPDFGVLNVSWTVNATAATLTLSLDASVLGDMPLDVGRTQLTVLDNDIALPEAAREATAMDHVGLDWNPRGHDPTQGHGSGYGVPHFDVHFYLRPWTVTERNRIHFARSSKSREDVDHSVHASSVAAPFLVRPSESLLAGNALVLDPGSSVPRQGIHWVPLTDWESVYRSSVRKGDVGVWSGLSYMLGSFDGNLTFVEIMISLDRLLALSKDGVSRTEELDVPQPMGGAEIINEEWGSPDAFPMRYFVSFDGPTRTFSFGWHFARAPQP